MEIGGLYLISSNKLSLFLFLSIFIQMSIIFRDSRLEKLREEVDYLNELT